MKLMMVDARGLACPKPVMMTDEALSNTESGTIEVLVDELNSADNIAFFAGQRGLKAEIVRENGHFKVSMVKEGVPPAPDPTAVEPASQTPTLSLIVATDVMGKEEALGKILMKAYFETVKAYKQLPDAIFFLNTGVRLTTKDVEMVAVLKDIEAMGVEIFTCGTCLKYFNLESELKVGVRGTTTQLIECMKDFSRSVWIG
jgi:selenium metabolism protein YedF